MYDVKRIKEYLEQTLSSKRYEHSLLVAEEAKNLAKLYNYDPNIAYITGLTHDIAKEFSEEENQYYVKKYNLDASNSKIIHADVGSWFCKEKYDFTEAMCEAIKAHTIGCKNMTLLDKIVFIADKIGRKDLSPVGQEIKKLAYQDLDKAIVLYLIKQQEKFKEKGKAMHPITLEVLNSLQQKTN